MGGRIHTSDLASDTGSIGQKADRSRASGPREPGEHMEVRTARPTKKLAEPLMRDDCLGKRNR